jgi:hypothetical protein
MPSVTSSPEGFLVSVDYQAMKPPWHIDSYALGLSLHCVQIGTTQAALRQLMGTFKQ